MRIFAQAISIIFHPLLLLTYSLAVLLWMNPYLFGVNAAKEQSVLILYVFLQTVFIPGFAVVMMKYLGFVKSFELKERSDRFGPLIVAGTMYSWIYINFINNADIPLICALIALGATISIFLGFLINAFSKISIHTIGAGGMIGSLLQIILLQYNKKLQLNVLGTHDYWSSEVIMFITLILAGLIGTARLILDAHTPKQIYMGYAIGILSFLIAYFVII